MVVLIVQMLKVVLALLEIGVEQGWTHIVAVTFFIRAYDILDGILIAFGCNFVRNITTIRMN